MKKQYNKALTPKELANRPDSEIDYSDIPELDEKFWAGAEVKSPQTKPNISLRLSQSTLDFFKTEYPKGYTSHMAAVLTSYAEAHQAK